MGAYAAVISLKHKIENITDPTNYPDITIDAYDNLQSLGDLLQQLDTKRDRRFDISAIKALDAEIRKVVWKLEDALDCCALHHSLPQMQMQMQIPLVDMEGVEQEIRSFINKMGELELEFEIQLNKLLEEEEEEEEEDEVDDDEAVSPVPDFGESKQSTTTTMGIYNDRAEKVIMERLLYNSPYYSPKSVRLVGMAGIGKTHLAREIYQHTLIAENFDITVWVRVGQKCRSVKKILLQIVAQVEGKPRNIYVDEDVYSLSHLLMNSLDGRRCLIILDDIWSETLCRQIMNRAEDAGVKKFLLTTRIRKVNDVPSSLFHDVRFMNNEESWDLLWRNVFPDKSSFPPQLERAGKSIAESCEGLPLLILAVADILSGEDKTEEYWNKVASKKTTTFIDAYEKILHVLCSSYDYLPEHLKACFLYLGVSPQSSEISLGKLIILLTVEEFVKPLDTFIWECIKKLVSNSLVMTRAPIDNARRVKSCKLHSAYWYLCVKEARKNKFFHALNKLTDGSEDHIQGQRRLSVQNNVLFGIKEVRDSMAAAASTTRSLLITGEYHPYPVPICYNSMFLKVLDALAIRLYEFPEEVVKLVLLRYLSLTHNGNLPCSISNLKHLQYLIVGQHRNIILLRDRGSSFLPEEIWDMQKLEYLRIMGRNLPDPGYDHTMLPKLERLHVSAHSCTEAVYRGVPNLVKLRIEIELEPDDINSGESLGCLENIGVLRRLVSLKCVVVNPWLLRSQVVAPTHGLSLAKLPMHLMKLSLTGLGFSWESMREIGSLMYLEVLKLQGCTFPGPYWAIWSEQFRSLEFLLLEDIDLVKWTISEHDSLFLLKYLVIRHCFKLKKLPRNLEDVESLVKIEVVDCSPSLVASAMKMHNESSYPEVAISSSWN